MNECGDSNRVPPVIVRMAWAIQAVVFLSALLGGYTLLRGGRTAEGLVLLAPILYISAVHLPLLTEARQSLPAQPVLLLLATIGAARLAGHLFPLETQMHEREHL